MPEAITQKEKELEALDVEIRTRLNKKQDLDSDIIKAENEKLILYEKLESIRADIAIEQDKKKILAKDNSQVSAEIKDSKRILSNERLELEGATKILNDKTEDYKQNKEKLDNDIALLREAEKKLKLEKSAFEQEKPKFYKDKDDFNSHMSSIEIQKQEELDKAKESAQELSSKISELDTQIERAKIAEESFMQKKIDLEKAEAETKQSKLQYDIAKQTLDAETLKLQKSEQDTENEKQKYIASQASFDNQKQALLQQEKELKKRELIVQRLVKEKQLDEEIKRLENALK